MTSETKAVKSRSETVDEGGGMSSPWLALSVLLIASFMGVLDVFIVNVAIPTMQADLQASFAALQFVVAGYTLAYAVGLVTGGRLGDTFGRRRAFILGTGLFGLTSAGCAMAPESTTLIVLRVLQGLSAAMMLPQVLAIIQNIFPADKRAKAIGFYGATIGLGAVLGQVIGGALLAWNPLDLGWRSIFLVNVPLCVVAIIGTRATVPELRGGTGSRLDLGGVVLLAVALFSALYPVITAGESGWAGWHVGGLVVSGVLFLVFVAWERRVAVGGGAPVLPLTLFRQPGFRKGLGTALFFYSGNAAFVLVLSYFLQRGLHLTPMQAAWEFSPMAAATAVASLALTRLQRRFGHRVVVVGGVMAIVGLLLTVPAVGAADGVEQLLFLQPGLLLYGFGGGLVAPSIVGLSLAQTASADAGAASGGLLTVTQAANAIGVATVGALFSALYATSAHVAAFRVSLVAVSALFLVTVFFLLALRARKASAVG